MGNNFKQAIQVDTLSNIILTEKIPIPTVLKAQIATTPATPNKTVLPALVTGHPVPIKAVL